MPRGYSQKPLCWPSLLQSICRNCRFRTAQLRQSSSQTPTVSCILSGVHLHPSPTVSCLLLPCGSADLVSFSLPRPRQKRLQQPFEMLVLSSALWRGPMQVCLTCMSRPLPECTQSRAQATELAATCRWPQLAEKYEQQIAAEDPHQTPATKLTFK